MIEFCGTSWQIDFSIDAFIEMYDILSLRIWHKNIFY